MLGCVMLLRVLLLPECISCHPWRDPHVSCLGRTGSVFIEKHDREQPAETDWFKRDTRRTFNEYFPFFIKYVFSHSFPLRTSIARNEHFRFSPS